MTKTTHFILFFGLFFILKTTAHGQILRGRVFQYLSSGDSVGLAGVQISVVGKQLRTQSKADGSFQLFLHDISKEQKIQIHAEKTGWRVLNDTASKNAYRVENDVQIPSIYLCPETHFLSLKTPFFLTQYIQKIYQKRLALLNKDLSIFRQTHAATDFKLKNIVDRKEHLAKHLRFLITHTSDLAKFIHIDNQLVTDTLVQRIVFFLREGKVEEASNILNEAQYKALKQKHLESPRDTQRWAELCLLAFLKAQCAMIQFNTVQADYYFNESLGFYDPQEFLNTEFYDVYIQFLMAFDEPKKAFETIQTLLIKANTRQNTEGVAYAYYRLQEFYFDKKLYFWAQKAGQNALRRFDTLVLIQKKEQYAQHRARVMRQLTFIYAHQDTLPAAIRLGEKVLLLPYDVSELPQMIELRLVLAQGYQKEYEQKGMNENRQKALFQLSVLQNEFVKNDTTHPSVKSSFEQYKNLKSYIENINKPRFLSKKQEIIALEDVMKRCKNTSQTIFYRSQIIELLEKLNNSLPQKSAYVNHELAKHYLAQAVAQIEQKNFREVESNAMKALSLDDSNDKIKVLLATAQWLQNKKPLAQKNYKTVKNSDLILKTISDLEKTGIKKDVFEPVKMDFGNKKVEL